MSPEENGRGRTNPPGHPDQVFDLFGSPRRSYPPQGQYPAPGQYRPQDPYAQPDPYQQDPYQQDRYDDYEPDGYDQGPDQPGGRGKLIAIFVGLGLVGLLIGVVAADLMSAGHKNQALVTPLPSATATETPGSAVTDDGQNSDDQATPSPTATRAPNYRAIPEDASSEKGLDFGFVTKVTKKGGVVSIRFDRAYFYTGAAATKHNKGVPPDDDYLIENSNPELRTFAVDPNASIVAVNRISSHTDGVSQEGLTLDEFVTNTQAALKDGKLPVWVRHTNGLTGPVTALAEQYLP